MILYSGTTWSPHLFASLDNWRTLRQELKYLSPVHKDGFSAWKTATENQSASSSASRTIVVHTLILDCCLSHIESESLVVLLGNSSYNATCNVQNRDEVTGLR
jgi:hypothetical protein